MGGSGILKADEHRYSLTMRLSFGFQPFSIQGVYGSASEGGIDFAGAGAKTQIYRGRRNGTR